MTTPELNVSLLEDVLGTIRANPEQWDQDFWRSTAGCGTTYCFAGWTAVLTQAQWTARAYVRLPDAMPYGGSEASVGAYAQWRLGLTAHEAHDLFYSETRDVDELAGIVKGIIDGRSPEAGAA
jgi:hypothetical protein